jgi:hypothetical protein
MTDAGSMMHIIVIVFYVARDRFFDGAGVSSSSSSSSSSLPSLSSSSPLSTTIGAFRLPLVFVDDFFLDDDDAADDFVEVDFFLLDEAGFLGDLAVFFSLSFFDDFFFFFSSYLV